MLVSSLTCEWFYFEALLGHIVVMLFVVANVFQSAEALKALATLSTFAGTQSNGYSGDGGLATAAQIKVASGVFVDSTGVKYVGDQTYIRKIDAAGIISTFYGSGSTTYAGDEGAATSAGGAAYFVCGSTTGTIYFSDFATAFRQIDTAGIITKFAGGGSSNVVDVPATSALISSARNCAVDSNGDVYLAAGGQNQVKKVAFGTNLITTFAGNGNTGTGGNNGPATSANFQTPYGLHIDALNGYLYMLEYQKSNLRKISFTSGIITAVAGQSSDGTSGDGGPSTSAALHVIPASVTGDSSGHLFITQGQKHNLRWIDFTTGIINQFAGTSGTSGYAGDGGDATSGTMSTPFTPYAYNGVVYVPEQGNFVVRAVSYTIVSDPSLPPTAAPTMAPSVVPTAAPSEQPTVLPTVVPTVMPTVLPTLAPTVAPSVLPTVMPTVMPTVVPTVIPTVTPTKKPTVQPSEVPTEVPTLAPSEMPTKKPTRSPTIRPSRAPSQRPSIAPTEAPSVLPTDAPTAAPSIVPSEEPTESPTTRMPSLKPSVKPTVAPTHSKAPSEVPSQSPTFAPTLDFVDISFDADIYLHNVTTNVLGEAEQEAVTNAVAVTLDLDEDRVTFVSQELVETETEEETVRRILTEGGYQIVVSVNVLASTRDFEDAANQNGTFLFQKLTTALDEAVATNEFTQTVRETSEEVGAVATLFVGHVNLTRTETFEDVTPEVEDPVDENHHEDESDDFSRGDFAGVVIGIIVSFMVLIFCCYYFLVMKSGGSDSMFASHEMVAVGQQQV